MAFTIRYAMLYTARLNIFIVEQANNRIHQIMKDKLNECIIEQN